MSLLKVQSLDGTAYADVSDAGALTLTGGIQATGATDITGALLVGGGIESTDGTLTLGDEDEGGQLIDVETVVTTTLSTSGETTAVVLEIPAGSVVIAVALKTTTTIAGTGAGATVALALSGGATDTLVSGLGLTSGTTVQTALTGVASGTSESDGVLTISGGAGDDNTPSAGAVKAMVRYRRMTALV